MNPSWPFPTLNVHLDRASGYFMSLSSEQGFSHVHQAGWATEATGLVDAIGGGVVFTETSDTMTQVLVRRYDGSSRGSTLALVSLRHGYFEYEAAGNSVEAIDAIKDELREKFPVSVASDGEVPVSFWFYTPQGARRAIRRIKINTWDQIGGNYSAKTAVELDGMMLGDFDPGQGGQLILWQGDPGTGKTHALRALAWEWRDWAELHYIVDPDRLFGGNNGTADYLMEVLLHDADDGAPPVPTGGAQPVGRWRVLVLEDTGEILAADAKSRVGQGLSRLLNVVDGLIGQGLRILVLVTTNEELKQLHPAVSRPGRCAAKVLFTEMTTDDADRWLESHDCPVKGKAMTLAQLFAISNGYYVADEKLVGFAR